MKAVELDDEKPRVGLVLAGAAALGAYEVGVLSYVIEDLGKDVGWNTMPAVVSGTSAGAINASALAAWADDPRAGVKALREAWSALRLGETVRPSSVELLSMFLDVTGTPVRVRRALHALSIRGGLLDPAPIASQIEKAPLSRIAEHVRSGRLLGIAVSATRVLNGEAVVFCEGAIERPRAAREYVVFVPTKIRIEHVLASAAIPLLFPAVRVGGEELFCDGGLRQMVPLSPALHLGAERLLVVNPLHASRALTSGASKMVTSPLFLAGKAINALFADRVEVDLGRLEHMNAILRAGRRRFGPGFERELNAELAHEGESPLHEVEAVCIEPTHDLGRLAAEYVRSQAFVRRSPGATGRLLRWLADGDPERAGDVLAYVMFDGGFTSQLIDLGRADARAQHAALCALFGPVGDEQRADRRSGRTTVGS